MTEHHFALCFLHESKVDKFDHQIASCIFEFEKKFNKIVESYMSKISVRSQYVPCVETLLRQQAGHGKPCQDLHNMVT